MNDDSMTIGIEAEMVTMTKTLMRIASALERIADMVELKDADGNLRGIRLIFLYADPDPTTAKASRFV